VLNHYPLEFNCDRWIKKSGLEHPSLDHLKRVRKQGTTATILLTSTKLHENPPDLPPDIDLSPAYIVTVPSCPALSMVSLKAKSTLWPVLFTPSRKAEPEVWTRGQVKWAQSIMQHLVDSAAKAQKNAEVREAC
jgi:tRNA-specific adenosine deaminase 3